jgi:transcriptional regulator with XRE-family HTH domain
MTLGDNVRWLRKRRGITQTGLAAQIRVSRHAPTPSFVSRLESGRADPRLSTVRSIARALHVKPWYLVADISDNLRFWEGYLSLTAQQKRDVQRHIDWLQRGHR